jgi:hypothetical protein
MFPQQGRELMAGQRLAPDATIVDVLSRLGDKDTYVSHLLHTMRTLAKTHGPVVVRIGVTGTGHRPSYRIERAGAPGEVIDAYDAQTHRPFTDVRVDGAENWSSRAMAFEEVENLLREIRGKGRR